MQNSCRAVCAMQVCCWCEQNCMGTCNDESFTVAEAQPLRLKHKPKTLILKHLPLSSLCTQHIIYLLPALYLCYCKQSGASCSVCCPNQMSSRV